MSQRILITDDDESVRQMMRLTLEMMGYACEEAENGNEALAAYEARPFDLVITDIIMPQREGLETIEELRRSNPRVKIIAISGGGSGHAGSYLKTATQLGANAVLAKPFSRSDLTEMVGEVLGQPQPEDDE